MFISPINFSKMTMALLCLVVICHLNAQSAFKKNKQLLSTRSSHANAGTKQRVSEDTDSKTNIKSKNGSPEFDIKIVSDYKASYGSTKTIGTNIYTFTNVATKTNNGENFASDIIVDLGATFNETGFESTTASLQEALNGSANLIKIYINDHFFSNDLFEYIDGTYRVKIANLGDDEIATVLGFKDLDKDGVYDDLEEGGSFKVTTITSSKCTTNENGYNAARILFNNNSGTNLRVHTEKGSYNLSNQIEGKNNKLVFPSSIDYDIPFGIGVDAKSLFDPRAYTGSQNQYSELLLTFSKAVDFSKILFTDIHKRAIDHTIEKNNTILRIKIPFLEDGSQDLSGFKIDRLQVGCFSNSTINVEWSWKYVNEDTDTCEVVWLKGINTIKTNRCTPFDLGIDKTVSDTYSYVGDEVIISTTVKNNSDVIAKDIVIKDSLSLGYEYISFESSGTYDPIDGEWKLSSLGPGIEKTLIVKTKILDAKNHVNTSKIISYTGGEDKITANNESSITVLVIAPKITLEQEGIFNDENNDDFAQVGETISYKFSVKNTGNTLLKNIIVSDPKVTIIGDNVIDSLAPNAIDTTTFLGNYVITQDDINLGAFHNKAEVIAYDIKNNQITAISQDVNAIEPLDASCKNCSVIVLPQKKTISLIKSFSIEDTNLDGVVGNLNDVITYYFDIVNTGNVTLSDVSIDDPMLGITKKSVIPNMLQPSQSGQLSKTYTIIQQDIDRGYVENIATAIAELPFGDINNSSDDVIDESDTGTDILGKFIENPNEIDSPNYEGSLDNDPTNDPTIVKLKSNLDLFITKEVNNLKPAIDEEVVFTIALINKGNTTVKNISVQEEIPDGYEYISNSTTIGTYSFVDGEWSIPLLNLGEKAVLVINAKVLPEGNYLNTASVLSYEGIEDSDETNNEASAKAAPICLVMNYDNSWNGVSNSGKELPIGTYYYVLNLGDGSKDKTGWLFINR